MAAKLSDPAIKELSLVFAHKDGADWSPRNDEARVLAVKGGEKKPFLATVVDKLKGYFQEMPEVGQYPVSADVADDIDNDGDGAEDYNQIVVAVCCLFNDIQQAYCISDDMARSLAIKCAIDSFLQGLDALRAGKDDDDESEKAGARHSADDIEKLHAIAAAVAGIGTHMDAMNGALTELGITGAKGPVAARQGEDEDSGPDSSDVDDDTDGSRAAKAKKKDEGKYGDVEYADTKNKKYPIDTEEHAKAAWSYINQDKNASEYSPEDLKVVRDRIIAACKKFGIEISEDSKDSKKAEEVEMTREEIQAMIADAAKAGAAATKAELQPQIDAAKATAEAATSAAEASAKLADAYKAQAENNAAVLAAVGGSVKPSIAAAVQAQKSGPTRLQQVMQNAMAENPLPTRI